MLATVVYILIVILKNGLKGNLTIVVYVNYFVDVSFVFALLFDYYYYTIRMSLVTGLFFPVLLLNQR